MQTIEQDAVVEPALWREMLATHAGHSELDRRFREHAWQDRELRRRETFADLDRPNGLFRYKLQSWPVFIDEPKVEELATLSIAMSELLRSVLSRVLDDDPSRAAAFYKIPEDLASLVMSAPAGVEGALSRGDFVATLDAGFQCVEFNVESNLGGWETRPLAEILLRIPALRRFLDDERAEPAARNTLRTMLVHVIRQAREAGFETAGRIDVVLGTREAHLLRRQPQAPKFLADEYRAALEEAAPDLEGTMAIVNYEELDVRPDGVFFEGRRIHAVVERHVNATEPRVFRAFKMGRLHLYNGPVATLLSDKRTLALLSEHAESDRFDAEERRLLADHLPWTRVVRDGKTTWEGEAVELGRLAAGRREDMVLKKAHSMGGAHVMLGRNMDADEWAEAWKTAVSEGDWIVQKYVGSRPYLFQLGLDGVAPFDAVWGPFVFGQTYAGAILRVQPRAHGGVVNLSRGAGESILLEVGA